MIPWPCAGALRWQANNSFEVNITGDYSRDRENGQARVTTENPNRVINFIPPDPNDPNSTGNGATTHNFFLGANSPFNSCERRPRPGRPSRGNPGTPFQRGFNNCDARAPVPGFVEGTTSGCANANTMALGQNTSTMPTYSDHDIYGFSGTIDWQISG